MRLMTLLGAALAVAGSAVTAPAHAAPATEIHNVYAVDADGTPDREYQVTDSPAQVSDCRASPAAVSAGIYSCYPNAASADVCWPSTSSSLLCADDPWSKKLHLVTYSGTLPKVSPIPTPTPYGIELDDGSKCRGYAGGPGGRQSRKDGYVVAYYCDGAANVLRRPDGPATIDRSVALWTVQVGRTDSATDDYPAPQTRTVVAAWFAAANVPNN